MANVWLAHVVPSLGNLLALLMLVSPTPAVLRLRVTGKLGDLNPWPLPLTIYNASGWLAYGLATSNPYLFPCNLVGFLAGVFFTLTAHSAATRKVQDRIAAIFVVAGAHFIIMGMVDVFALTRPAAERMWGINAIIILMVYYLVPLSTLLSVLRTRSAASIYPPLAVAATACGGLWAVYGFALQDMNLWLPNLFGAVIGIVQLVLRAVYGTGGGAVGAATASAAAASAGAYSPFADGGGAAVAASPLKPRPGRTSGSGTGGGGGGGISMTGLTARAASGAVSLNVVASGAATAAAGGGGGAAGAGPKGGRAALEAPEDHPAAKHPGAKEGRRMSILQLLHPFHTYSAAAGGGAATGGSSAPLHASSSAAALGLAAAGGAAGGARDLERALTAGNAGGGGGGGDGGGTGLSTSVYLPVSTPAVRLGLGQG